MTFRTLIFFSLILWNGCQKSEDSTSNVITSDIENFWTAYDEIIKQPDSSMQIQLLEELFLYKGTPGLKGIMEAKRYSPQEYIDVINRYPNFWKSIRANTLKAGQLSNKLEQGISKLKTIYPELKPAKIYFTIGAMRSGGTTLNSLVLIGSELAMTDSQTNISDFEGNMKEWAENYVGSNPLGNIVLLNVHEYVHTQQNPIPSSLLLQCLYEGVAEFVSVKAMGVSSSTPAVAYGKNNQKVKEVFEAEMFYAETNKWLWSNAPNQFNTRDLGYYIGYKICDKYYEKSNDKILAIKEMIELDYTNEKQVHEFIDNSNFFSKPINSIREDFERERPMVLNVEQIDRYKEKVDPKVTRMTINFSRPMNKESRGFDFGPMGEENVLRVQKVIGFSDDGTSFTFEVKLEPNKHYQSLVTSRFMAENGIPIEPYLIDFKTKR